MITIKGTETGKMTSLIQDGENQMKSKWKGQYDQLDPSNLSLDIDNPVSFGLGLLRERTSLASGQPHRLIFLNEYFL